MEAVSATIAALDLTLISYKPTFSGANCCYHALIQQGRRATITLKASHHEQLRRNVCDFALNATNPAVLEMKVNFDVNASNDGTPLWDDFFKTMKKKGVWVDGPVLPVASFYLEYNVYVVSPRNTQANPWLELRGGEGAELKDPILLGNAPGCHYQSLLPSDGFASWKKPEKHEAGDSVGTIDNISKVVDPITSTPSKQTLHKIPSKQLTPMRMELPGGEKRLTPMRKSVVDDDVAKIVDRIRRRCHENMKDLDLLVRDNRRLRAQKCSLSFKLGFEKQSKQSVKIVDLDASLDASIFDDGDEMDTLLSSFEA